MTYDDPRLAAIYDVDNPDGPDHDFFRRKASQFRSKCIIDLGCGTGLLTVSLPQPGRTVTGIDPSRSMLNVARAATAASRSAGSRAPPLRSSPRRQTW